ncbi:hypothetical protein [Maribacter sp. 2304DJ31-5]|uniref:hypothetical protein n=1 Tax=Maribacter sp. 2304DJ31-5 TaxID=3386273 RepID=UPI0039BD23A3
MTNSLNKPPIWFWIVSALALLWNMAGVMAYLQQAYMSIESLEKMDQAERLLYESQPAWATGAFAIAVWAGALGCIALLLRKKWATPLFIVSLIGVLGHNTYMFFLSNTFEVLGSDRMAMPIFVILISLFLVFFSRKATAKNWLS